MGTRLPNPQPANWHIIHISRRGACAAALYLQPILEPRLLLSVGLLFLGSQAGSSCFVEVLWEALRPSCSPFTAPHAQLGQHFGITSPCWEVLPLDVAGIQSLAPVRGGVMIDDPSGCGDTRLLLSCGTGASGRLALGRWAANLVPVVSGGPSLPVSDTAAAQP